MIKYFLFAVILLFLFSSAPAKDSTLTAAAKGYLQKIHKPQSMDAFKALPHLSPFNQDTTNACWSFSTLSFLESEMLRLGLPEIRLSPMFPVYYAFIEKARYFVESRGESRFAAGDLFSGVMQTVKKYGLVPQEAYKGQTRSCKTFNHTCLEKELKLYMQDVKKNGHWDEQQVLREVKRILDKHLGPPPQHFVFNNKEYTPATFRDEVVKLPWQDYIILTSFTYAPFYRFIELRVPDNWAHRSNYYNIPLEQFYSALKDALRKKFTVAFDCDTNEPGRMGEEDVAFIPEFDIPSAYITQEARQFRFDNGSTTDVHLMHIVGYKNIKGDDWFLVKDSWRSAWYGKFPGYFFFHGDYMKLKTLAILVHGDAVASLLKMHIK